MKTPLSERRNSRVVMMLVLVLSAVSGAEGAFRFTSVPSGSYTIIFKMKGTKKVKRMITVSTGDLDLGEILLK